MMNMRKQYPEVDFFKANPVRVKFVRSPQRVAGSLVYQISFGKLFGSRWTNLSNNRESVKHYSVSRFLWQGFWSTVLKRQVEFFDFPVQSWQAYAKFHRDPFFSFYGIFVKFKNFTDKHFFVFTYLIAKGALKFFYCSKS